MGFLGGCKWWAVCRWCVAWCAAVARFTAFRFCLNPTGEQEIVLGRHAGAARFGYNQCLR
ncbi:helix-turn-helix domain-containing protein, partial [Micromonospora sp. NPDC023966]|uniref:helix-turn-helix domain-containing protein n=1 Tax=Micromonospora sp. NPDC023966 TaxID=3154699 RepID=UPI00340B1260